MLSVSSSSLRRKVHLICESATKQSRHRKHLQPCSHADKSSRGGFTWTHLAVEVGHSVGLNEPPSSTADERACARSHTRAVVSQRLLVFGVCTVPHPVTRRNEVRDLQIKNTTMCLRFDRILLIPAPLLIWFFVYALINFSSEFSVYKKGLYIEFMSK